ncbi:hypothetical protein [Thauera aromatica]|uniref:Uncharacterized protein n=1 Tax=Thauera aromatica K172 TaxID=44139 RepID=A0A2R4BPJ2_THAAR|nr:hypothetical protein [Thauera aromatica]AVR89261.1 hypothetical protein Tharo_2364 [Thauera aromatica K172]MCK2095368.1 hypothetical protein [Thauera aromatica]
MANRNYSRADWQTAQVVDDVVAYLMRGGRPASAKSFMNEHLVPPMVQRRVLANQAAVRHRISPAA